MSISVPLGRALVMQLSFSSFCSYNLPLPLSNPNKTHWFTTLDFDSVSTSGCFEFFSIFGVSRYCMCCIYSGKIVYTIALTPFWWLRCSVYPHWSQLANAVHYYYWHILSFLSTVSGVRWEGSPCSSPVHGIKSMSLSVYRHIVCYTVYMHQSYVI